MNFLRLYICKLYILKLFHFCAVFDSNTNIYEATLTFKQTWTRPVVAAPWSRHVATSTSALAPCLHRALGARTTGCRATAPVPGTRGPVAWWRASTAADAVATPPDWLKAVQDK